MAVGALEEEVGEVDWPEEFVTTIAEAAAEAKTAAEETKEAAEEVQAVVQGGADAGGVGPASERHAVSLDLDIDANDLEAIVRGIKAGVMEGEYALAGFHRPMSVPVTLTNPPPVEHVCAVRPRPSRPMPESST